MASNSETQQNAEQAQQPSVVESVQQSVLVDDEIITDESGNYIQNLEKFYISTYPKVYYVVDAKDFMMSRFYVDDDDTYVLTNINYKKFGPLFYNRYVSSVSDSDYADLVNNCNLKGKIDGDLYRDIKSKYPQYKFIDYTQALLTVYIDKVLVEPYAALDAYNRNSVGVKKTYTEVHGHIKARAAQFDKVLDIAFAQVFNKLAKGELEAELESIDRRYIPWVKATAKELLSIYADIKLVRKNSFKFQDFLVKYSPLTERYVSVDEVLNRPQVDKKKSEQQQEKKNEQDKKDFNSTQEYDDNRQYNSTSSIENFIKNPSLNTVWTVTGITKCPFDNIVCPGFLPLPIISKVADSLKQTCKSVTGKVDNSTLSSFFLTVLQDFVTNSTSMKANVADDYALTIPGTSAKLTHNQLKTAITNPVVGRDIPNPLRQFARSSSTTVIQLLATGILKPNQKLLAKHGVPNEYAPYCTDFAIPIAQTHGLEAVLANILASRVAFSQTPGSQSSGVYNATELTKGGISALRML